MYMAAAPDPEVTMKFLRDTRSIELMASPSRS